MQYNLQFNSFHLRIAFNSVQGIQIISQKCHITQRWNLISFTNPISETNQHLMTRLSVLIRICISNILRSRE